MQKRPTLRLPKTGAAHISPADSTATIEYRVTWNERAAQWDVSRNGTDINASRRKKQSAIDLAIRKAQTDMNTSPAKFAVTTVHGGVIKTEWTNATGAVKRPA